jgi:ABC-2 type transport system permease protein
MKTGKSKLGIVIAREYSTRVKKKSFIILTILMPLLFVGFIFGTLFLATVGGGENKIIVVDDQTGEYFPVLKDAEQYHFVKNESFEEFRKQSDDSVYATLVITDDLLENPKAITLYSYKQVVGSAETVITSQLNEYLSHKKLASYNIPNINEIIKDSRISIEMKSVKLDESGKETETSATMASIVGMVFTVLIYMFILSYGAMVMQGVSEEKTNRIVEIMVSSVKPFDLMMGKLIGIGLVGLTQFGIWALLFLGISSSGLVFAQNYEILTKISEVSGAVNLTEICLFFLLFFVGGYLMYASIFAAIGAIINSPEDAQQYMMPITILILFAFYAGFFSAENPDGPLAFWTSLIPFTSPIVMMIRLPFGVPWWQMLISIALLFATVILIVTVVAKIYRVGILMYGKKPSWPEIVKWMKY